MKKIIIFTTTVLFSICSFAQQELGIVGNNNWLKGWTEFDPMGQDYPKITKILSGNITKDLTLSNLETYHLIGEVYVTNNATLTIEPGTIIRASSTEFSSLIVTKGSKIIAEGSIVNPIVFTSDKPINERKSGDWGGVYILGSAPLNTFGSVSKIECSIPSEYRNFGGDSIQDSSGKLKNLRIEFAGKGKNRYQVYDAFTLAGVGEKTTIQSVQVSVSNGNSFKVIGGKIKAERLVSFRSKNSDFDFSQGTNALVENGLAVRNPFFSANSNFRAVTIQPFDKEELTDFTKPKTNVSLINFTMLNDLGAKEDANGLIKEAVLIKEQCEFSLKSSVISGFDSAVLLDEKIQVSDSNLNKIKLQRVFINNCKNNIVTERGGVLNDDLEFYYASKAFGNLYSKTKAEELFVDVQNNKTPDFRIKIGSVN